MYFKNISNTFPSILNTSPRSAQGNAYIHIIYFIKSSDSCVVQYHLCVQCVHYCDYDLIALARKKKKLPSKLTVIIVRIIDGAAGPINRKSGGQS